LGNISPEITLIWKRIELDGFQSFCFEALHEKHLYSVNILTGDVLFDGYPPCRLPAEVLENPLYKRTFGEANFDSTRSFDGSFESCRPIDGYFYTFFVTNNKSLIIHRLAATNTLILLDGTNCLWTKNLPVRLKKMYSHWYCKEKDIIILSGINFRCYNVEFIICESSSLSPRIFKIPNHLTSKFSLDENNYDFDEMLVQSPSSLTIFMKFESFEYIHSFVSKTGNYVVELPRFNLSFEKEGNGEFRSLTFAGHKLCNIQQFDDGTLREFHNYLLLEDADDKLKMIVSQGIVSKKKSVITTDVSDAFDAELKINVFEIHGRFKILRAKSIASRLQLAALYCATSSFLIEDRTRMTGDEYALELVRESWKNYQLNAEEVLYLGMVKKFGKRNSALLVLCRQLEIFSISLEKGIIQNFQIEYSDNITSYISEKQNFSKLFSNWRRDLDFNELITSSGSDTSKFQFSFFQNIITEKDIEQNFGRTSSIHILIGRIHNILNELLHIVEDITNLNDFPMQCS
jgi:hypothetical protein